MPGKIVDEVTGVLRGKLTEDMIDTVKKTKRPFISVLYENIFEESGEYPYTYVPSWLTTLPLKKDTEIIAYFNQGSFQYPVLWKLSDSSDYDDTMLQDIKMPSNGDIVSFPEAEKVIAVHKFTDSFYYYVTDKYILLQSGDESVVFDNDDNSPDFKGVIAGLSNFSMKVTKMLLEVTDTLESKLNTIQTEVTDTFNVKVTSGGVDVGTVTLDSNGVTIDVSQGKEISLVCGSSKITVKSDGVVCEHSGAKVDLSATGASVEYSGKKVSLSAVSVSINDGHLTIT